MSSRSGRLRPLVVSPRGSKRQPESEGMIMNTTATLTAPPTGQTRPRRTLRRVAAVCAGLVAIFAVTTATDAVMHASGVFPPVGQPMGHGLFLLATAYRIVFGVFGCYLAARLAPDRPMQHALILGFIGLVLSTAGAVAMWDAGPGWYPLAIIAISVPCAWLGGRLHIGRARGPAQR